MVFESQNLSRFSGLCRWSLAFVSLAFQAAAADTSSHSSNQFSIDVLRSKPGFAIELTPEFCQKLYPYGRSIPRKLNSTGKETLFNLFTFTVKPFDSKRESIVIINGGPGGISGPGDAQLYANEFPNYNLVFFHYRGAGCSALPSDASFDKLISTESTIDDMEAIREFFGISSWRAVFGESYGTNVARTYAHEHPNQMQFLILEGLDDQSHHISDSDQVPIFLKTLDDRFSNSPTLKLFLSASSYASFRADLKAYLDQVSPQTNFGLAAFWNEEIGAFYTSYYAKLGIPQPSYLNKQTALAIGLLVYIGEGPGSDDLILWLAQQFGYVKLDPSFISAMDKGLLFEKIFYFPFDHPHYAKVLRSFGLLSWRVQRAMIQNDALSNSSLLCNRVKTLALSGTQDLATPEENVDRYLNNKSCAAASNLAVFTQGGGHTNQSCLGPYLNRVLAGGGNLPAPQGCEQPVSVKQY